MGFRFRRSIRLLPGVKINLGKKGASLSVGGRGATVNFSAKGRRTTLGIPGTGISYSTYQPRTHVESPVEESQAEIAPDSPTPAAPVGLFGALAALVGAFIRLAWAVLVLLFRVGFLVGIVVLVVSLLLRVFHP